MFYDYVKIYVKGGDGGDGMVAFRREKFVPMGGPAGGDGGRGGSIIFVGDASSNTLEAFKYKQHFKGERGQNGMSKSMYGKNGQDIIIKVPIGTIVRDDQTKEILADITEVGQELIVAKGGRGGRGNIHFQSAKNRAPEIAEKGEPGQERWLRLELKLIADVGLVGMPNAGKSTIISKVSGSKPKIADYPFTTLVPNLGVVNLEPGMSFVMADVPGLIEGASEGLGLGHRFLRHVERTRLILHVVDMSGLTENEPWEDYKTINDELQKYRADLANRPKIIVANKMDMPDSQIKLQEFKKHIGEDLEIFQISALTGQGLRELMYAAYERLQNAPEPLGVVDKSEIKLTKVEPKADFIIQKDEDGAWLITGEKIEKVVIMTDWSREESLKRLSHILNKMGVDDALRKAGARDGETVRIANKEFDFSD
jgi:GTP-binding protein